MVRSLTTIAPSRPPGTIALPPESAPQAWTRSTSSGRLLDDRVCRSGVVIGYACPRSALDQRPLRPWRDRGVPGIASPSAHRPIVIRPANEIAPTRGASSPRVSRPSRPAPPGTASSRDHARSRRGRRCALDAIRCARSNTCFDTPDVRRRPRTAVRRRDPASGPASAR